MSAINAKVHHVNVTVPRSKEEAAKSFYKDLLGLNQIEKPEESRGRGGAWYQIGGTQLHLSLEEGLGDNCISKRHVCFLVESLDAAEDQFRSAGVQILPDDIPTRGWARFYVRDPGGNRLEIAQAVES